MNCTYCGGGPFSCLCKTTGNVNKPAYAIVAPLPLNYSMSSLPLTDNMTKSVTGGLRDNKAKIKHSLVPTSTIEAIAEVIHKSSTDGGGKYPLHNWRKGLPWTDVADSASRHIRDFLDGKDIDKESGLHTLKHAITNLAFLIEYLETCPQLDNRFKKENK